MEHDEVHERLELAAVEPGGLDRLMAGDTASAAAVAGHVAGCPACADELERLRAAVPLLRDVVRTTPPADLRERTLAFVRERGDRRPAAADASGGPAEVAGGRAASGRSSRRDVLPWIAAIAAAVVISVIASSLLIGSRVDEQLAAQERQIGALERVTAATIAITGEPDAARVTLASTGEAAADGTLLFSPSTTELVVVADGLTEPPAGQEYRCWLVIDGQRRDIGRMFFADTLAFWVGETPEVATVSDGTAFGVSLVDVADGGLGADPVIAGEL